jgi:hypothetical protein
MEHLIGNLGRVGFRPVNSLFEIALTVTQRDVRLLMELSS